MTEVIQLCRNDMPSPELFTQEHTRRKIRYLAKAVSERPSSCARALADCDDDLHPNTYSYTLLRIACTCQSLPASVNVMHVHYADWNFMRAGIPENRFTSLALMHIQLNLDTVVDLFAEL